MTAKIRFEKASEFLLLCAQYADKGLPLQSPYIGNEPPGWHYYVTLTQPETIADAFRDGTLEETRTLRLMLAAAIAKSEGN